MKKLTVQDQESLPTLISQLRGLIEAARGQALRAVDSIQVRNCWEIGQHIVEFEQLGADRAAYGIRLIPRLAESLTAEFGRGFDASNLRYMRLFYLAVPIRDALRHELSLTDYRNLLRVDGEQSRHWYMNEAADQNWSTRALDRKIGTLYYERLLASRDRDPLRQEAAAQIVPLQKTPREFVRDPVLLEFLGLPETGRLLEADLEQALINKLQAFLLELGNDFSFVARQMRVSTETRDFYIDLVFYNYLLKCFVLFDLKAGELADQDIGQMDMYVRIVDDLKLAPDDQPHSRHHPLRRQRCICSALFRPARERTALCQQIKTGAAVRRRTQGRAGKGTTVAGKARKGRKMSDKTQMKITPTTIPDLLIIEPKVFGDARGFFYESFNQKAFNEATGQDVSFV